MSALPPRTTWKPLPIWCADGELAGEDLARLRTAKDSLWLDYLVKPVMAEFGIEERVLAWGSAPPSVCAYALVDPAGPDSELEEAVAWVLRETDQCRVAMSVEDVLGVLMGGLGVREMDPEELLAEQRLADYERGV